MYAMAMAAITPAASAIKAQVTAWRVFLTPTEPKYTAMM